MEGASGAAPMAEGPSDPAALAAAAAPAVYPEPEAMHEEVLADRALFMHLLQQLHTQLANVPQPARMKPPAKFRVPVGEHRSASQTCRQYCMIHNDMHGCCSCTPATMLLVAAAAQAAPSFSRHLQPRAALDHHNPRMLPCTSANTACSLARAACPSQPVCGKELDLHTLYARVTSHGGLESVRGQRALLGLSCWCLFKHARMRTCVLPMHACTAQQPTQRRQLQHQLAWLAHVPAC